MDIYSWLLTNADPSLVYQAARDLLRKSEAECIALRKKIIQSGYTKIKYDVRMEEGIVLLEKAQMKNGIWKGYSQPGKEYYTIDRDKWNTLRAIRVLDYFGRKNNEL